MLTRTPRGLRTETYGLRVPAACVPYVPEAQGSCCTTVRTPYGVLYAYQPWACRTYRAPWHRRCLRWHSTRARGVRCSLRGARCSPDDSQIIARRVRVCGAAR
eukprot:scaffold32593_cov63-Phaeocystis_antarctica.AAC.2